MSTRVHLSLLIMVAALASASPIASVTASPTVRVTYHDLHLDTAADVATLYKRIRSAAISYCKSTRVTTGTRVSSAFDFCMRDAVATTIQKINQPNLSAYYAAHAENSAS